MKSRRSIRILRLFTLLALAAAPAARAEEPPIAVFILSGQSNMVGQGDGSELPVSLRRGNDRVLLWIDGAWQPLRPVQPASESFKKRGIEGPTFGPEISFGEAIGKAWPERRIGIIKVAVGGTGILAWSPQWSKEQADRSGDGKKGDLYRQILDKVAAARGAGPIELKGFFWKQGGKDSQYPDLAGEYFENLRNLIVSLRRDLDAADLPAFISVPFDPSNPPSDDDPEMQKRIEQRPGMMEVARAWVRAGEEIPGVTSVAMPGLERWPQNVHYNTNGILKSGRLFAEAYLESVK